MNEVGYAYNLNTLVKWSIGSIYYQGKLSLNLLYRGRSTKYILLFFVWVVFFSFPASIVFNFVYLKAEFVSESSDDIGL